jgi:ADP-heptose:LPS heptosyltransferase
MSLEIPPQSIGVIVGLDLIGDGLLKLPFIRALRAAFPQARIDWLTAQGKTVYNGALRALTAPYVDQVLEQPAFLVHPATTALPPAYDILLDTRGRWRAALAARRLPHRLFIAPAARFMLSDRRPPRWWHKPPHIQDRLLQLVTLAAGFTPSLPGGIAVPAAERAIAVRLLPEAAVYLGLVPGAGNTVKIWPLPRFIALAQQQAALGRVPVFLLGPQETGWQAELAQAVPTARFPLQDPLWQGQLSLAATMAVGERLHLAVTNDNGTSHMLAAVDCPLVSLFGPTAAAKSAPRVSRNRIVMAQTFGQDAMTAIPVAAVAAAVQALLAELNSPVFSHVAGAATAGL